MKVKDNTETENPGKLISHAGFNPSTRNRQLFFDALPVAQWHILRACFRAATFQGSVVPEAFKAGTFLDWLLAESLNQGGTDGQATG